MVANSFLMSPRSAIRAKQAKPGETADEACTAENDGPSTVRKQRLMERRQLIPSSSRRPLTQRQVPQSVVKNYPPPSINFASSSTPSASSTFLASRQDTAMVTNSNAASASADTSMASGGAHCDFANAISDTQQRVKSRSSAQPDKHSDDTLQCQWADHQNVATSFLISLMSLNVASVAPFFTRLCCFSSPALYFPDTASANKLLSCKSCLPEQPCLVASFASSSVGKKSASRHYAHLPQ